MGLVASRGGRRCRLVVSGGRRGRRFEVHKAQGSRYLADKDISIKKESVESKKIRTCYGTRNLQIMVNPFHHQ